MRGVQDLRGLGRLRAGDREVAVDQRGAGRAGEKDRHVDPAEPVRDLADDAQGGVVPAHVHAGQAVAGQDEAGDLADVRRLVGVAPHTYRAAFRARSA